MSEALGHFRGKVGSTSPHVVLWPNNKPQIHRVLALGQSCLVNHLGQVSAEPFFLTFNCDKIYQFSHFKVYSSVKLNIHIVMQSIFRTLHLAELKLYPLNNFPFPPPCSLMTTTILFSVSEYDYSKYLI